jgi:nicotinamidase-related amidase
MTNTNNIRRGLLVVDVQNDVMGESIKREEVVGNIVRLVEAARTAGVPVVWVRHSDEGLALGSPGWEIVPELVPAEGEQIVEKTFSDSFAGTDLAQRLSDLGIGELVLCGAQSDACIRNTFYGALYHGYPVTLVGDAHTTGDLRPWGAEFSPEQSIAVLNMQASFTRLPDVSGAVTTTAEAFAEVTQS